MRRLGALEVLMIVGPARPLVSGLHSKGDHPFYCRVEHKQFDSVNPRRNGTVVVDLAASPVLRRTDSITTSAMLPGTGS